MLPPKLRINLTAIIAPDIKKKDLATRRIKRRCLDLSIYATGADHTMTSQRFTILSGVVSYIFEPMSSGNCMCQKRLVCNVVLYEISSNWGDDASVTASSWLPIASGQPVLVGITTISLYPVTNR